MRGLWYFRAILMILKALTGATGLARRRPGRGVFCRVERLNSRNADGVAVGRAAVLLMRLVTFQPESQEQIKRCGMFAVIRLNRGRHIVESEVAADSCDHPRH
jgi:hypothetical protein